jgi:hypothetical protein
MQIPKDAVLLRIFLGEDDKAGHLPLFPRSCSTFEAGRLNMVSAESLVTSHDSSVLDVGFWPVSDVASDAKDVGCLMKSGLSRCSSRTAANDPSRA